MKVSIIAKGKSEQYIYILLGGLTVFANVSLAVVSDTLVILFPKSVREVENVLAH